MQGCKLLLINLITIKYSDENIFDRIYGLW